MWASSDDQSNTRNSSSSSSSSPSPFSQVSQNQIPVRKTMEEVWKDINLTGIHEINRDQRERNSAFKNMAFQDFLAVNFRESSPNIPSETDFVLGSPLSVPPPATVLSLNCAPGFKYFDSTVFNRGNKSVTGASSYGLQTFTRKRMGQEPDTAADRRQKRMIKNRESAARSRARKQAYTTQMELEIANLMVENAKLRKQQQQLMSSEIISNGVPERGLCRTSTAPF